MAQDSSPHSPLLTALLGHVESTGRPAVFSELPGDEEMSDDIRDLIELLRRHLIRLTPRQRALAVSALITRSSRRELARRFSVAHQTVSQQLAAADLVSLTLIVGLIERALSEPETLS